MIEKSRNTFFLTEKANSETKKNASFQYQYTSGYAKYFKINWLKLFADLFKLVDFYACSVETGITGMGIHA